MWSVEEFNVNFFIPLSFRARPQNPPNYENCPYALFVKELEFVDFRRILNTAHPKLMDWQDCR